MMTLSLDTTDQASVIVRDDDKSSIRLTNVEMSTVHRIWAISFNFLVWKACEISTRSSSKPVPHSAGYRVEHGGELSRQLRRISSFLTSFPLQSQQFSEPDRNLTAPVCRGICLQRTEVELISRTDEGWKYAYTYLLHGAESFLSS